MKKTESAGGIILNKKKEVLVVSQHGTSWSLPKGHIDPGEDRITAARREIYEETGLKNVTLIRELETYERYKIGKDGKDDTSELKVIHMFLFTTDEMKLKPIDPHNPEARWMVANEVTDLLTHRKDKEFYLNAIKNIK